MAMPVTMENARFTYSKTVSRGRSIYLCLLYYYVTPKERKVKKKAGGEDGTDKTLSVIKNPRKKKKQTFFAGQGICKQLVQKRNYRLWIQLPQSI